MNTYDEQIEQLIYLAEDAIYDCDYEYAKRLLMSAVYDEPGYFRLHYTLAWMYHYHQINEELAERHYQATVYFEPGFFNAYRELTELYLKRRKFEALEKLMDKAIACPEIPKDYVFETLGKIEERRGDFKAAILHYKRAQIHCMNNDYLRELKQTVRRVKFKQLKNGWLSKVKSRLLNN